MATVLGLDSATSDVAVAVTSGGEVRAERSIGRPSGERPRHGSALLATVEDVVDEAGGWPTVELIAVGLGPGSFTGLRIGLATAKALAQGRGLPLRGVSSLAALGRGIGEQTAAIDRCRLAVIDARRDEVFASLYGIDGESIWGPVVLPPGELAKKMEAAVSPALAAGDGALRFRRELEVGAVEVLPDSSVAHRLSARHVCLLSSTSSATAARVEPVYLRQPDAKRWRDRDHGNP